MRSTRLRLESWERFPSGLTLSRTERESSSRKLYPVFFTACPYYERVRGNMKQFQRFMFFYGPRRCDVVYYFSGVLYSIKMTDIAQNI